MIENQTPDYLDGLNAAQREAVHALDGPVLVLAGAGTGKTRVLTTRLAHILNTGRAWPSQILAVTFTNKAAQEMRERVSSALGGAPVEGWWLGTFHALAARMLRRHADLAGLRSDYTIIDTDDQVRLFKQIMDGLGIDTKKHPPKVMAAIASRWKDKALTPDRIDSAEAGSFANGRAVEILKIYNERLRIANACDFGDLLLHTITILQNPANAHILEDYHRRFRYILVDEYQDTNVAQYLWLRLLAKGSGNLCCVGDDDQSIYGWRGAEVGNILRFEQDFPGAKIVRLEQNYRSTANILGAAGGVIAHNRGRLGKTLRTERDGGAKVVVRGLWDSEAEARWIAGEIETLRREGWPLDQIAVLVRTGFQMRAFEERFIQIGLPYKVIGGPRFYERMEIRDALAYLRVVAQPSDDLALERILNTPKRGIGDSTLQTLHAHARAHGVSLYQAISDLCAMHGLKPKMRETLSALIGQFDRWRSLLSSTPHDVLAGQILEESGYLPMWQAEKTPEAQGRVENLREFVSGVAEFESLQDFLEHVALVLENQDSTTEAKVSIMTLHGAKGLEFDAVFLPGWEDGLFPSQRTMDENGQSGLEEERRLAYVGLTRAAKRAWISHVANRRMYGNWINALPSRFLDELPKEHIEIRAEPGLYGAEKAAVPTSMPKMRTTPASTTPSAEHPFAKGTRVSHAKFGDGTVVHRDGHKLDIAFDTGGLKRVLDSFVTRKA